MKTIRVALVLLAIGGMPTSAMATLILLSDVRTVYATTSNDFGTTTVFKTATPLQPFHDSASVPGASASMNSTLSSDLLDIHLSNSCMAFLYPYGGDPSVTWISNRSTASSAITFLSDGYTPISLTGWRDNETLGGLIAVSLTDSSGTDILFNWTGWPHNNNLQQSMLLAPGSYTLTTKTDVGYLLTCGYDGGTLRLDLTLAAVGVPDAGHTAAWLASALIPLLILRRKAVVSLDRTR